MPRARKLVQRRVYPAKLLADLQRIGFSEYEARIYLCLLGNSPATAYEISKEAGLPRANTYAALESLKKKSAVQPVTENPVRYTPVLPDTLLSRVSTEINDVCDRLVVALRDLPQEQPSDVVWTVSGDGPVHAKFSDLIANAKRHIWIKADESILHLHEAELKKAAERDLGILIIMFGSDPEQFVYGPACKVYLHEGTGIRLGQADNLFTIVVDFQLALTASRGVEITAAYTSSDPVLRMAETLIRHDVYMAEIFQEFGPQIEKKFGTHLLDLRRKTFSPKQLSHLERNLRSWEAKREITN